MKTVVEFLKRPAVWRAVVYVAALAGITLSAEDVTTIAAGVVTAIELVALIYRKVKERTPSA